jgi:hypothetical protein
MVRAIDAQQVILQTSMAEKIQQIQQQNPDMQQRYFALQLSEEDRVLREKVKQSDESEKAIIREKEEHEGGKKWKDQHNKDNKADQELLVAEEGESSDEGGHINIKV